MKKGDTLGFKETFKIRIYGYRVISVPITVIDSFILACQRIFLRVLVICSPGEMDILGLKRV